MKFDALKPGQFYGHDRPQVKKGEPPIHEVVWVIAAEPEVLSGGVGYIGDTKKFQFLESHPRVCNCHFWLKIKFGDIVGWLYLNGDESFSARK